MGEKTVQGQSDAYLVTGLTEQELDRLERALVVFRAAAEQRSFVGGTSVVTKALVHAEYQVNNAARSYAALLEEVLVAAGRLYTSATEVDRAGHDDAFQLVQGVVAAYGERAFSKLPAWVRAYAEAQEIVTRRYVFDGTVLG